MKVQGCDCSIIIKTTYREIDVPYSEETIREAVSLLQEEASIEGDGTCKAIQKKTGVTGCIVTPLTIGTAHHLIYLAMGFADKPVFVSETRSLYSYKCNLLAMADTECFDLIQDRKGERRHFEGCRVQGFEMRFEKGQAVKLKLEITGERKAAVYPYDDVFDTEKGELFNGDNVTFRINGREYQNIYGLTLIVKKENGTKTEIWIRRSLEQGADIPEAIEELTITARLLRDIYEWRQFGVFSITLKRLVFLSDETGVNTSGAVIGPLRYYVSGSVFADVFDSFGSNIS
jgi:hypothetical protein